MRGVRASAGQWPAWIEQCRKAAKEQYTSEHELRQFATATGKVVTIRPVAGYLMQKARAGIEEKMRSSGEPIDPPTYTVTTASSATETHSHDATTVQTDEERALWAAHLAAKAKLENEKYRATVRLLLLRGLDVPEPPETWPAEMKALGVDISSDPVERKLDYIQIEILPTKEDITRAMEAITRLAMLGADEDDIEAAVRSFRPHVERASGGDGHAAAGRVELQPGVPAA